MLASVFFIFRLDGSDVARVVCIIGWLPYISPGPFLIVAMAFFMFA